MSAASEPVASRPTMPGYGLPPPEEGSGLLPWSWAEERLRNSRNYWIATARPDQRPHLVIVWGLWNEGRLCFSTGKLSRKARNLAHNPSCVIATERADEALIVEGLVETISDEDALARMAPIYEEKYGSNFPPDEPLFAVRPKVAFGFIEQGDFSGTATRWTFR
jgi:Pyridoxamine 5'-phosphate oxidase